MFILIGVIGGGVAGLLGVGGGILFVPCLYHGFVWSGVEEEMAFLLAVGTSLSVIIVTSLSSSLGHAIHGNLNPRAVLLMAVPAIPSAMAGAGIGSVLGGGVLRMTFGVVALLIAIQFFRPAGEPKFKEDRRLWYGHYLIVGGISGLFSAILGVGGGILTVPLLHLVFNRPMNRAVPNSSGLIVFSSIAGTIGWIISGWNAEGLPAASVGYVNMYGWALISITAVVSAQIGALGVAYLDHKKLRIPFGVMMVLVGIKMLLS